MMNEYYDMFVDKANKLGKAKMPSQDLTMKAKLIEELLGLNEEVGELTQLYKKDILYGKIVSSEDVLSELGDVLYYLTSVAHHYNITLQDIMEFNIKKLKNRWGEEKF